MSLRRYLEKKNEKAKYILQTLLANTYIQVKHRSV